MSPAAKSFRFVSFRLCVRTCVRSGCLVEFDRKTVWVPLFFPCLGEPSLLHSSRPPNILSNFSWAYRYVAGSACLDDLSRGPDLWTCCFCRVQQPPSIALIARPLLGTCKLHGKVPRFGVYGGLGLFFEFLFSRSPPGQAPGRLDFWRRFA